MIWLFISIVLLLLVFHAGFRKFALWLGGIAAAVAAVALMVAWWNETHPKSTGAIRTCLAGVQDKSCFDPTTAVIVCEAWQHPAKDNITGVQSCYDPHDAAQLAEHLRGCKHQPGDPAYMAKDTIVADRRNIPCNSFDQFDNDCPGLPATPWPGCVSRDPKPWSKYPKATAKTPVTDPVVLNKLNSAPDCPRGQQAVALNNDAPWSCYDPQDTAQVAQHLKECKPSGHFFPDTDRRGVSCAKSTN